MNSPTPIYIIEERKLRRNLRLIADVARRADVEIILAFKAFALWKTFPVFCEYIHATTASSLNEALLAYKEFGAPAHTYSPAYTESEFDQIAACSSHLTFNSLSQYERFHNRAARCSLGLRVNPEYSEVGTLLYNPCAPGTRFGVGSGQLPEQLPADIEGFHCHCHCESGADVLQRTLVHIEQKFSRWFPQLKWLNLGGGHLMTRKDYDVELLVSLLQGLHQRYPWLRIILEPGSAFAWQTGPLVSHVVDIVEDHGIKTAVLDVSFTCHMPDCLEMPYYPEIKIHPLAPSCEGGEYIPVPHVDEIALSSHDSAPSLTGRAGDGSFLYRLGGNSCLSGDFMGSWLFPRPLAVGDEIIFEDMIHYTTVKTTTFNGVHHPSIAIKHLDGTIELLREYRYEDYRERMD